MNTVSWQAKVTVATIVTKKVNDETVYLCVEEVCKRTKKLVINQPAGHIEANETLIEASIRETLEETGWHVAVTKFLGVYTYQPFAEKTFYRFCFLAEPVSFDETYEIDTDIDCATWYSLEALQKKDNLRSPLVLKCITDAEQGKSFDISVIEEFLLPT